MIRLRGCALPAARAIVFDKDGVLVDFLRLWEAIARERARLVYERTGLGTEHELQQRMGLTAEGVDPSGPLVSGTRAEALVIAASFLYERGMDWLTAKSAAETSFEAVARKLEPAQLVRPTGPLEEVLSALCTMGIKLAVATTDLGANAERDLELLGLSRYFEVVLGSDAVRLGKPHPDLFLLACERLGVAAHEAWMIGDALGDLRMARQARAGAAIAVASGITPAEVLAPEADRVIAGVWELLETIEPVAGAMAEAWYELYTDGAARGNPGPAALGAVLLEPGGQVLSEVSEPLGIATNNVAEYRALLRGLVEAQAHGVRRLVVKADSELMIKQLKGDYAVKSDLLRPLFTDAIARLRALDAYRLIHVRREANRRADALANQALDNR